MAHRKSPFAFMVRCLRVPALAAAVCVGTAFAQSLAVDSPFAPVGGGAVSAAAAAGQPFELDGASVQGPDVSVCIFERQAKRSQWIPVGGEMDGIHVISYDGAHDTAMVMIDGARKQISMRKASAAPSGPVSAGRAPLIAAVLPDAPPAPIASAAPVTPQTAASAATDQREARMLVSDLLEIGVQQRKAYQEAKQRAAAGTPPSPSN